MLRALSAVFLMSQYVFNPAAVDWDSAFMHCLRSGGQLLVPGSAGEVETVQRLMASYNVSALHVGVHDKFLEGHYVTLLGNDLEKGVARLWARGSPSGGMSRNCVALTTAGLIDIQCSLPLHSLCSQRQWTDYVPIAPHGRYRLATASSTWASAWAACRAEGAQLAVLNGEAEARAVGRAFPGHAPVWIGAHAMHHPDAGFRTVHGDSLAAAGFERWADSLPTRDDMLRRPFAALHNAGLRAHGHSERLAHLCERPL